MLKYRFWKVKLKLSFAKDRDFCGSCLAVTGNCWRQSTRPEVVHYSSAVVILLSGEDK